MDDAVEQVIPGNPLPAPRRRKRQGERRHYPAVTELAAVGSVLRASQQATPSKGVNRAHLLLRQDEAQGCAARPACRSPPSGICRDAGRDGDVIEAQLDHVVGTRLRLHTTERAGSNFAAS